MDRSKAFNGMEIKLEAAEMHDQLPYPELGKSSLLLLQQLFTTIKLCFT